MNTITGSGERNMAHQTTRPNSVYFSRGTTTTGSSASTVPEILKGTNVYGNSDSGSFYRTTAPGFDTAAPITIKPSKNDSVLPIVGSTTVSSSFEAVTPALEDGGTETFNATEQPIDKLTTEMSGVGSTVEDLNISSSTAAVKANEVSVASQSVFVPFSTSAEELYGVTTEEVKASESTPKLISTAANTPTSGLILNLEPLTFGLIVGGAALLIFIVVVSTIICIQRRKKARRFKKDKQSDAWITRSGSGGVGLVDLTSEPKIDLEARNDNPVTSRLSALVNEPVVNIFSNNNTAFDDDAVGAKDVPAKRESLRESGNMPEKKIKGLTEAKFPVVSSAKDEESVSGESVSPNTFCSDTQTRKDSFSSESSVSSDDSNNTSNRPSVKYAGLPGPPPPPPVSPTHTPSTVL